MPSHREHSESSRFTAGLAAFAGLLLALMLAGSPGALAAKTVSLQKGARAEVPDGWTRHVRGDTVVVLAPDSIASGVRWYRMPAKGGRRGLANHLDRIADYHGWPAPVRSVHKGLLDDADAEVGMFVMGTERLRTEMPSEVQATLPGAAALDSLQSVDHEEGDDRGSPREQAAERALASDTLSLEEMVERFRAEDLVRAMPARYRMIVAYVRGDQWFIMDGWTENLPGGPMTLTDIQRSWRLD